MTLPVCEPWPTRTGYRRKYAAVYKIATWCVHHAYVDGDDPANGIFTTHVPWAGGDLPYSDLLQIEAESYHRAHAMRRVELSMARPLNSMCLGCKVRRLGVLARYANSIKHRDNDIPMIVMICLHCARHVVHAWTRQDAMEHALYSERFGTAVKRRARWHNHWYMPDVQRAVDVLVDANSRQLVPRA